MQTNTNIHNAAAALGRRGGASTSPAKRIASRANGAKGGRPRALAADLRAFERRCEQGGCNDLAFRASPLRAEWADWQTTYTA